MYLNLVLLHCWSSSFGGLDSVVFGGTDNGILVFGNIKEFNDNYFKKKEMTGPRDVKTTLQVLVGTLVLETLVTVVSAGTPGRGLDPSQQRRRPMERYALRDDEL